jgi:hypothetical protein
MPGYISHLADRGYRTCTVHQYVQASEHFGRWLGHSGRTIAGVDEALIETFIVQHLPRCRCRIPRKNDLQHLGSPPISPSSPRSVAAARTSSTWARTRRTPAAVRLPDLGWIDFDPTNG